MSDYIRKSNDYSIEKKRITKDNVSFTKQLIGFYPKKDKDKNFDEYDFKIHKELNELINNYKKNKTFSLEQFYEVLKELYQNIKYYSYLGLFTGLFIILLRREKIELLSWFSKNEIE